MGGTCSMQWARETTEVGYLRLGFRRGFQWWDSVTDCSGGSYESVRRFASSNNAVQFLRRVSNYQIFTRTVLRGVTGCGAQANGNNPS
jgi:hypothetical protein